MVCLHPLLIRPQIKGLYLERGHLLLDCLEDWYRFCEPLSSAALDRIEAREPNDIKLCCDQCEGPSSVPRHPPVK